MKISRVVSLVLLLAVVAAGTWLVLSRRGPASGGNLRVYYTKLDGTTLGTLSVSLRPRQPGESDVEHARNVALYAAVEAVAGPPSDVPAIHFPPGTRVLGVTLHGETAYVDLSSDVDAQPGGSFAENGEFKGLVYTLTGLPGVDAVGVTIAGRTVETLPGGHLELDEPLHRSDW
ncbi:MAG TPA: GerMN domain-containing protein [Verrucomicrobiae bacterium]|nr:GerMN domain-containing protein [Verrucomicrobiae bacterium]